MDAEHRSNERFDGEQHRGQTHSRTGERTELLDGDSTSGDGDLAPVLARAAVAAGCDGVFMEVHENPERALSDGPNQLPLKNLPKVLRVLKAVHAAVS